MKKNKIILFVLALVLLAGIIMVCVKGFNVSLDLRAHDTLKFVFDQKFKKSDVIKVCDEVFKDKEYEIKTVEVFSDAVYIISPSISLEEQESLLEKLDNLYKTEEKVSETETITDEVTDTTDETTSTEENTSEDSEETIFDRLEKGSKYDLYHDSKVRIRDIVKPYIMPSIISAIIIVIYIAIKYRKLNGGYSLITVCKILGEMLVVLLEIVSVIAITRIPFSRTLVPIVMFIVVISLCIRLAMLEKELKNLDE